MHILTGCAENEKICYSAKIRNFFFAGERKTVRSNQNKDKECTRSDRSINFYGFLTIDHKLRAWIFFSPRNELSHIDIYTPLSVNPYSCM